MHEEENDSSLLLSSKSPKAHGTARRRAVHKRSPSRGEGKQRAPATAERPSDERSPSARKRRRGAAAAAPPLHQAHVALVVQRVLCRSKRGVSTAGADSNQGDT